AEVRQALIAKGYPRERLPSERTMRDILNRMNYRLKRIKKGKPLKNADFRGGVTCLIDTQLSWHFLNRRTYRRAWPPRAPLWAHQGHTS
ncbi:MAG: hypothetical protein ACXVCF_23190, partial [Isosphaeraceae bacterium]